MKVVAGAVGWGPACAPRALTCAQQENVELPNTCSAHRIAIQQICVSNRRIAGERPEDNRLSTQRADESLCEHDMSAVREVFEQQRALRKDFVIR
jgi:hypothetical protein